MIIAGKFSKLNLGLVILTVVFLITSTGVATSLSAQGDKSKKSKDEETTASSKKSKASKKSKPAETSASSTEAATSTAAETPNFRRIYIGVSSVVV